MTMRYRKAFSDIALGACMWRMWHHLAAQEVRQRYRRSTLGPFWLTGTIGIQILTMGWLVSILFDQPIWRYLPYVAAGFVIWNFWLAVISEGAMSLISAAANLTQAPRPISTILLQVIWRNVIVLGHHAIFIVALFLFMDVHVSIETLLVAPGLALLTVNLAWIVLVLAVLSVRFRDVPAIVQNIMTIFFWITPILYLPEQLGNRRFIADFNPLTHLIDVVRRPMLGETPGMFSYIVVATLGCGGALLAFMLFARVRHRISYWL